jgi:hypothetical protein
VYLLWIKLKCCFTSKPCVRSDGTDLELPSIEMTSQSTMAATQHSLICEIIKLEVILVVVVTVIFLYPMYCISLDKFVRN